MKLLKKLADEKSINFISEHPGAGPDAVTAVGSAQPVQALGKQAQLEALLKESVDNPDLAPDLNSLIQAEAAGAVDRFEGREDDLIEAVKKYLESIGGSIDEVSDITGMNEVLEKTVSLNGEVEGQGPVSLEALPEGAEWEKQLPDSVNALIEKYGEFVKVPGQEFLKLTRVDRCKTFLTASGGEYVADFRENPSAFAAIGIGDLAPVEKCTYVKKNGVLGKLTRSSLAGVDKVGYEDQDGNYLGIDTGSRFSFEVSAAEVADYEGVLLKNEIEFETFDFSKEQAVETRSTIDSIRTEFAEAFPDNEPAIKAELLGEYTDIQYDIPEGINATLVSADMKEVAEKSFRYIMNVETGGESNRFIRTRIKPGPGQGASSAFGPAQITMTLAKGYRKNYSSLFTVEERTYLDRFVSQGRKFLNVGKHSPDDPTYGFGGKGEDYFRTEESQHMYMRVALKIWEQHIRLAGGDIMTAAESWRGKKQHQDRRYFRGLMEAVK